MYIYSSSRLLGPTEWAFSQLAKITRRSHGSTASMSIDTTPWKFPISIDYCSCN